MRTHLYSLAIVPLALVLCNPALSADRPAKQDPSKLPPASTQANVTFDKHIKPIFEKACVECHGPQKAKGGARYDSREASLKGGKHGNGIVPNDSAKSALVWDVATVDEKAPWMPQKKSKIPPLTEEEVGLLRAWIDQGTK